MEPTRVEGGVRVGGDARQRFYEARGYGEPIDGSAIRLAPVEAAYLLYRGDLPPVDGRRFSAFLEGEEDPSLLTRFLAYKDLRERGFYLAPRGDRFDVFERGSSRADGDVAYRVRPVAEHRLVPLATVTADVLAIVDEEGEVGYVEVGTYEPSGTLEAPPWTDLPAVRVGERVVVPDPPSALYRAYFYGQPIEGRTADAGPLQLGLVEATYLADRGILDLSARDLLAHAREVEGDAVDRRLAVYRALRDAGAVPKTGLKFGTDFRVYHDFDDIDAMGHSDVLVRVLDPTVRRRPAELALDVRLAHGVGKRMVFALAEASEDTTIGWSSITRLTP